MAMLLPVFVSRGALTESGTVFRPGPVTSKDNHLASRHMGKGVSVRNHRETGETTSGSELLIRTRDGNQDLV